MDSVARQYGSAETQGKDRTDAWNREEGCGGNIGRPGGTSNKTACVCLYLFFDALGFALRTSEVDKTGPSRLDDREELDV
jgi:hypothetical protein